MQAMGNGVLAVRNEVEESTDFSEAERDQASMDRCPGVRFGLRVGLVAMFG
jgi:hypothetical protein